MKVLGLLTGRGNNTLKDKNLIEVIYINSDVNNILYILKIRL